MLGVEGQPNRLCVLDLVGCEAQVPFVRLYALPAALGVAYRSIDLVPQRVECIRHMEKRYLGLRSGYELLERFGQNGAWPELAGTLELLLGVAPPAWRVPVFYRWQLVLDGSNDDPLPCRSLLRCNLQR